MLTLPVVYSYLNATIGSTFVALRAGPKQASSATDMSTTAAAANVTGSAGVNPKSSDATMRVRAREATTPTATPIPAVNSPCPSTRPRMVLRLAPSAMRTPISLVRRVTEYAMTPYIPATASRSAVPANTPSRITLKGGPRPEPGRTWENVANFGGTFGATSRTM